MATVKPGVKKQVYKQIAPTEKIAADKAAKKTETPIVKAAAKTAEKPDLKAPVKASSKEKTPAKDKKNTDKDIGHIVYQPSSEILERAVQPNEMFGIGDAMPIYYL